MREKRAVALPALCSLENNWCALQQGVLCMCQTMLLMGEQLCLKTIHKSVEHTFKDRTECSDVVFGPSFWSTQYLGPLMATVAPELCQDRDPSPATLRV
jgi:hypothetical protein